MTDAIEIALISDDNDQINSLAVWDVRNGTQLMQYKGNFLFTCKFTTHFKYLYFCFRWWCCWKTFAGSNQWKLFSDSQQFEATFGNLASEQF